MRNIILLFFFCIPVFIYASANQIVNVRQNVTTVSQNSDVNTGIDLGQKQNDDKITGNGDVKSDNRKIGEFSKINITGDFQVEMNCGIEGNITITAESNLIPVIMTDVTGDTLTVAFAKPVEVNKKINIKIDADAIDEVKMTGVENAVINGLKSNDFNLITTSSDGKIEIKGNIENFAIDETGDSMIDAESAEVKFAKVKIIGDSKIKLPLIQALDVNIMGDGEVLYKGNPKITKKLLGGVVKKY